ncbi:MAG TPA: hypothetical protein VGE15_12705 [Sphingobacteriaceae bacterium]
MKTTALSLIALFTGVWFTACSSGDDRPAAVQAAPEKKIMDPFRFHQAIEVKPGLTFDVLSWGRGSAETGAYLILRSDSSNLKYRSVTGELDGRIVDAWNMDMDSDGNPEIFIQAEGEGEGSHLTMYIYEFNDSGSGQKLTFPGLSSSSKKGYKGQDSIFVRDGKLRREFPVYEEKDAPNKPTGGKKRLEYRLRNNSFIVQEIKEEAQETKKK